MQEAMLELNYSPSYAKASTQLKDTDSWQALLEEQIPDALLTKVLKGLLTHGEWRARDAGLEKAFKTKRKYADTLKLKHILGDASDADIEGEEAGIISEAIGLITGEKTPKRKQQVPELRSKRKD